jgi:hypothetical protein
VKYPEAIAQTPKGLNGLSAVLARECESCGKFATLGRCNRFGGDVCGACASRLAEAATTLHQSTPEVLARAVWTSVGAPPATAPTPRRGATQFQGDGPGKAIASAMRAALTAFQKDPTNSTRDLVLRQMDAWAAYRGVNAYGK